MHVPVVMVSFPPNSIAFTRPHVVPLHTFSSHIVCCSTTSHMMFTGCIGCSAISVSFVNGVGIGRDQVLCVLKGSCFLFIPMQWLFAMLSSSEIGRLGCIVVMSWWLVAVAVCSLVQRVERHRDRGEWLDHK